jgi:hypothetical protein
MPRRPSTFGFAAMAVAGLIGAAPIGDRSLSPDEYRQAGVPDAHRRWSAADMAAALRGLTAASEKGTGRLPTLGSARSGALFARLIALENLEPYRKTDTPLDQRMGPALDFQDAANGVFRLYLSRGAVEGGYRREVVELTGLTLHTAVVLRGLVRELLPTLKKDDPTYLTRMQGLQQARNGLATSMTGALGMLYDKDLGHDRARLVTLMAETFPSLMTELAPPQRADLLARCGKAAADGALIDVRTELQHLHQAVGVAATRAPEVAGPTIEDLAKTGLTLHHVQAGDPDTTGWCLARSTRGGFSIRLPGRFNDFSQALGPGPDAAAMEVVGMETPLGVKFTAMRLPPPRPGTPSATGSLLDFLAGRWEHDGRAVQRRAVRIDGREGGELAVSGGGQAALVRVLQTKDAAFQMMIDYPEPLQASIAGQASRFFDSFKLE